jgi:regulator of Ty1 transposition protein 103
MTTIATDALAHRLRTLLPTQQSIEGTSNWCLFYSSEASNVAVIVAAWGDEMARAPNDRKLALLYLANHILQEGKRKGRLFGEEFAKVIVKGVRELLRTADSKLRTPVTRVVRVWEERKVFGASVIKSLKELLAKAEASAAARGGQQGGGGSRNGEAAIDEATRRKLQVGGRNLG